MGVVYRRAREIRLGVAGNEGCCVKPNRLIGVSVLRIPQSAPRFRAPRCPRFRNGGPLVGNLVPVCTHGRDFLTGLGSRCLATWGNAQARRARARNLAPCVHTGGTIWHQGGLEGPPCLQPRSVCTRGTYFLMGLGSRCLAISGKRASEAGPRQKPRPVCTHGAWFLAAAGIVPRRNPPARTASSPRQQRGPATQRRPALSSRLRRLYSVK